jgi:hypothetical protein
LHGTGVRRRLREGVMPGRMCAGNRPMHGRRPPNLRRDRGLGRYASLPKRRLHRHAVLGFLHGGNVRVLGQRAANMRKWAVGGPGRLRQPSLCRCQRYGVLCGHLRAERDALRNERGRWGDRRRRDMLRRRRVGRRKPLPVRLCEWRVRRCVCSRNDDVLGKRCADLRGGRPMGERRRVLESGVCERRVRRVVHARGDPMLEQRSRDL